MPEPFSVICLSSQDWRVALPTNRQQIMLRAARRGHDVLFVETGFFLGRHLSGACCATRGADRSRRASSPTEEVVPGVRVCKALNVLPWRVKFRLPNTVNCAVTARLVRRLAEPSAAAGRALDLRSRLRPMAGSCGEEFAVYDCVDDYVEQTTSPRGRAMVVDRDRTAALRSRLVFATSTTMYERQRRLNPRRISFRTSATTSTLRRRGPIDPSSPEVADLAAAGARLRRQLPPVQGRLRPARARRAESRREGTLLLIGPAAPGTAPKLERLGAHPNVRWLGPKAYAGLPRYVAAFDVGLIPYVENDYTRSCFPLKLYEYLSAGKPVVASGLPELAGMEPDVTLVDGAAAFVDAIEAALGLLGDDGPDAADAGRLAQQLGGADREAARADPARARDSRAGESVDGASSSRVAPGIRSETAWRAWRRRLHAGWLSAVMQ